MNLGNQNNNYFHRLMKARAARNTISHLWDESGQKVEEVERIKVIAEEYYKKLFGSNNVVFYAVKAARVQQVINRTIYADQSFLLVGEVTTEEIRKTSFDMKSNKALGSDDFTSNFFQRFLVCHRRRYCESFQVLFCLG
jgi:hypothetical protein